MWVRLRTLLDAEVVVAEMEAAAVEVKEFVWGRIGKSHRRDRRNCRNRGRHRRDISKLNCSYPAKPD